MAEFLIRIFHVLQSERNALVDKFVSAYVKGG